MSWRIFLPLPLAALLVGSPLELPRLDPPLKPDGESPSCGQPGPRAWYLRGYAYLRENPRAAGLMLEAAEQERRRCRQGDQELAARINALRRLLPRE